MQRGLAYRIRPNSETLNGACPKKQPGPLPGEKETTLSTAEVCMKSGNECENEPFVNKKTQNMDTINNEIA